MSSDLTVLIPCLNEEVALPGVLAEFRAEFPDARILVVDNGSNDRTAERAVQGGADLLKEPRPGKSQAVIAALEVIDTPLMLMVDGDGSYPAEGARRLLEHYRSVPADMTVGVRKPAHASATTFRPLHQMGTAAFGKALKLLFRHDPGDVFSGLRLFTRRFYANIPILSRGFELEIELTIQAVDKGFSIAEVEVPFRDRAGGTESKLRTFSDGFRILRSLLVLFRDYRPLLFFGVQASAVALLSLAAGTLPVIEYLQIGLVKRFPLAFLAASLGVLSALLVGVGIILESGLRHHREAYQVRLRRFHQSQPKGTAGEE